MRVDQLMYDRRYQVLQRRCFARWSNHEKLQLLSVLGENLPPPTGSDAVAKLIDSRRDRLEQCAARHQRENRGVDQRLDDLFLPAVDVVETIARLQFAKNEFYFPARSISGGDFLGGENFNRNARQVAMILPILRVADRDETEAFGCRVSCPVVAPCLGADLDFNVENVTSQTVKDGPQRLPDQSLVGGGTVEDSHDLRIRVLLEPREEVATTARDVLEELEVIVPEVEEHEFALDPIVTALVSGGDNDVKSPHRR